MPPKAKPRVVEEPQDPPEATRSESPESRREEPPKSPKIPENPDNPDDFVNDEDDNPRHASVLSDQPTASLTEAILLMTKELRRRENPTSKAKAKEPDTFDGSDPKKLNNFILLCNLTFRSNLTYAEDSNKVNFALSYLRGTALEYYEPSILDSDEVPAWMDNWSAFVRNIRT